MAQLETISSLLGNFRSVDSLKKLLWTELNYDRANQPLPLDSWTERQREGIAAEPTVIATHDSQFGSFDIIYCPIDQWDRARGIEREAINVLLREHPYALFVFSDPKQRNWHFVNVKYAKDVSARRLFRRITVGPYERLRTATERLAMLDLASLSPDLFGLSPLAIQQRHDEAFDVEAVTKEFFREYDRIFKNAERMITGIDGDARRLFTQKLFNRLMFIVFLERKGWLRLEKQPDHDYLWALWETYQKQYGELGSQNFFNDRLQHLFFIGLNTPHEQNLMAINSGGYFKPIIGDVPYLNGGLFEKGDDDSNNSVGVPDEAIQSAINELFYRFNFTVTESTPFDVEVAVDPEMLGKIFEELVTGRHETGSYYTPKPIVSFMGREALKSYLRRTSKESSEAIASFVDKQDASKLRNPEVALEALKTVRICDPACGSGAYLLGMMHELLDLRQALFTARDLDNVTIYNRKLEIIQKNVYGVDKDQFAVNIARLRLWLSLIVDFEPEEGQMPPPLPNLDYKVEVGDSLTGPDPSGGVKPDLWRPQQIEDYRKLKEQYLDTHGSQKTELRKQIEEKREEIRDWMRSGKREALLTGYDWAVEFTEVFTPDDNGHGGFDIVLANPPYVRQELIKDQKPALKLVYGDQFVGTADLYTYFYFRGLQLLKPGGELVFISSNKWLRAAYGEKLRSYLKERTTINVAIDFGDLPVFGAIAYPCVVAIQKTISSDQHEFRAFEAKDLAVIDALDYEVKKQGWMQKQGTLDKSGWVLTRNDLLALLSKLRAAGKPLGEYVNGAVYRGIVTGLNDAFVISEDVRQNLIKDKKNANIIKPWLRGRDVKRWQADSKGWYLLYIPWDFNIDRYPGIKAHLTKFKPRLEARPEVLEGRFPWYALSRYASEYASEFEKPKIITPAIVQRASFAFDVDGHYSNDKTSIIVSSELYLLGILNSKAADYVLQSIAATRQGGFVEYKPMYVSQIPIPDAEHELRTSIEEIVHTLLNERGEGHETEALETELNRLVYEAYGLTEIEISLIEAELSQNETVSRLDNAVKALDKLNKPARTDEE